MARRPSRFRRARQFSSHLQRRPIATAWRSNRHFRLPVRSPPAGSGSEQGLPSPAIVCISFAVRTLAAIAHPTPTYFPDEYVYAAVSRSLGETGRPLVRGAGAHFPALLEPLLAAPIWASASTATAYHLIQAENALFMSLAAVPVYLIARRLAFSTGYSLACAAFSLAVPDLAYSAFNLADPLAYPLALTALLAALVALQAPSRRSQLAFVGLATLATLARAQYVVLTPAFLAAATVIDRRTVLRVQRLPIAIFAAGAAGALALGSGKVLGYYSSVAGLHLGGGLLRWSGLDLFLLTLAGGIVLVPGALVGMAHARGRRDSAFAVLAAFFAAGLMFEAALYASNGSDRFHERYLFALLPLLPLGFGLYLRQGRPGRLFVTALAGGIVALTAAVPLSQYATGTGFVDSPLLWAVSQVESLAGVGTGSLLVAACAGVAAVIAATVAWSRSWQPAFAAALVLTALISTGAGAFDLAHSRASRTQLVASDPGWVDAQKLGDVAAVQTSLAPRAALVEQLFWNRSLTRELVLAPGAEPTDAFAAPPVRIDRTGVLRTGGNVVRSPLLFQRFAVTPVFQGATFIARAGSFTLWRPAGVARLRLLETGRFWDGWLAQSGRLEVWPGAMHPGTVSFTLSLPKTASSAVTIRFAGRSFRLAPGDRVPVSYRVQAGGRWLVRFQTSAGGRFLGDLRPVSVRSTTPRFTPIPGSSPTTEVPIVSVR